MEWPHGLAKTIKNDDRDSPRVQSSRGDSSTGKKSNAATHNGSTKGSKSKKASADQGDGRPQSAPASGRKGGDQNRRLSVAAAATPAVKGERPAGPLTTPSPTKV